MTEKKKNHNDIIVGMAALAIGAYFLIYGKKGQSGGTDISGGFPADAIGALNVASPASVAKKASSDISLNPYESMSFFGDKITAGSAGFSGTAYGFSQGGYKDTLIVGSKSEPGFSESYVPKKSFGSSSGGTYTASPTSSSKKSDGARAAVGWSAPSWR